MPESIASSAVDQARMPQVGMKFERKGHQLEIVCQLASGAFSKVFKVISLTDGKYYAMKVEDQTIERPSLILDAHVLQKLSDSAGFPRFLVCGRTNQYNFVVMQMLGQDIAKLRLASPDERFSPTTALRLASETLNRIEQLHSIGFLSRDIKAQNFAVGWDSQNDDGAIYMFDFGLSRCFRGYNDEILPARSATALLGTMFYASIASHDQKEQCRKDDLESWFYMCVELFKGYLPWSGMTDFSQHRIIADLKRFCRGPGRSDFLKECPIEFDKILELIDSFGYFQPPDYWKVRVEIGRAIKRLGLNEKEPYDWQRDPSILHRSNCSKEADDANEQASRNSDENQKTAKNNGFQ